jgi:hypothetical protein
MKKEKENRIGTLHGLIQQLHRKDKAFQMFVYPKEIEVHTPLKVFTIPFGDSGQERYSEVLEVLGKKMKGGSKT